MKRKNTNNKNPEVVFSSVVRYSFFCNEVNGINFNLAYYDGPNLERDVGGSLIYNYLYIYPHRFISGDDFAFLHLKDFDKIIEVRKSDGLIVAKYNCD